MNRRLIRMILNFLRCILDFLFEPIYWLWSIFHAICNANSPIPSNTFYQDGDLIVHERQSLQLCAIHAINNLLQLTPEETTVAWVCGDSRLPLGEEQKQPCTKQEMNELADHLTATESSLLSTNFDDVDITNELEMGLTNESITRRKASFWQRFSSNHRSILFGNYSFEVKTD